MSTSYVFPTTSRYRGRGQEVKGSFGAGGRVSRSRFVRVGKERGVTSRAREKPRTPIRSGVTPVRRCLPTIRRGRPTTNQQPQPSFTSLSPFILPQPHFLPHSLHLSSLQPTSQHIFNSPQIQKDQGKNNKHQHTHQNFHFFSPCFGVTQRRRPPKRFSRRASRFRRPRMATGRGV